MSRPMQFAQHLTVRTSLGETEFREVDAEVADGVLIVSRNGCTLTWFAAGAWTEASFL